MAQSYINGYKAGFLETRTCEKERRITMHILNEASIIKESSQGYYLIPLQDEMLEHREVELVGEVDAASVNALARQLRYLQRQDPEASITLYINSPGGSVDSGMALYDVMQAVSCPIRTVCVGLAASMAALIFVSGAERDMLPHRRIMIHDPLIVRTGGNALKLKAISDDLMETRQIIAKIIADHSGKSMDEILAKTASDSYFRAEDAVEFGLADRIITSLAEGK